MKNRTATFSTSEPVVATVAFTGRALFERASAIKLEEQETYLVERGWSVAERVQSRNGTRVLWSHPKLTTNWPALDAIVLGLEHPEWFA